VPHHGPGDPRTETSSAEHEDDQGAGLYASSDDPDSKRNKDGDEVGGRGVKVAIPERPGETVLMLFF
jgi:hypothetical protein